MRSRHHNYFWVTELLTFDRVYNVIRVRGRFFRISAFVCPNGTRKPAAETISVLTFLRVRLTRLNTARLYCSMAMVQYVEMGGQSFRASCWNSGGNSSITVRGRVRAALFAMSRHILVLVPLEMFFHRTIIVVAYIKYPVAPLADVCWSRLMCRFPKRDAPFFVHRAAPVSFTRFDSSTAFFVAAQV